MSGRDTWELHLSTTPVPNALRGVVTEDQAAALAERNAARAEVMRQRMGSRYILHPSNKAQRRTERTDLRWFGPRIHIHDQAGT